MIKNVYLISFQLILSYSSYSQDSILFHSNYLPQHIYNNTTTQKFHLEMTYSGSDTVLNKLKEKGITNPSITNREMNFKTTTSTGYLNAENKVPVQLEFIMAHDQDGNSIIPEGTKMFGFVSAYKLPVFDSVASDNMGEEAKTVFLKRFRNFLSQVSIPDKKMTVGDQFTQTTPINLPLGPINLGMIISITYKLVSVTDNTADFNLTMKFSINMNNEEFDATGGGEGNGVMVFDRINQYPLKYELHNKMDVTANKNQVLIRAILTSHSLYLINISKK
jgi:hypothetical protein